MAERLRWGSARRLSGATDVTATITGLPSYETIINMLDGETFSGSSITLSEAEVESGLTLTSYSSWQRASLLQR